MNDLLSRLPHKPPALLLTHVYEVSEQNALCGAIVSESALIVFQGLSSAYVLEMLAQSAALVLTQSGRNLCRECWLNAVHWFAASLISQSAPNC